MTPDRLISVLPNMLNFPMSALIRSDQLFKSETAAPATSAPAASYVRDERPPEVAKELPADSKVDVPLYTSVSASICALLVVVAGLVLVVKSRRQKMRVAPEQPMPVATKVAKRKVNPEAVEDVDGTRTVEGWATLERADSGDLRKRGPGARAKKLTLTPPRQAATSAKISPPHGAWE